MPSCITRGRTPLKRRPSYVALPPRMTSVQYFLIVLPVRQTCTLSLPMSSKQPPACRCLTTERMLTVYTCDSKVLLTSPRWKLAAKVLKCLMDSQQHNCWECDEKVTEQSYDMHHKKRLSLSAGEDTSDPSNLATLCKWCDTRHTEAKQLACWTTPTHHSNVHGFGGIKKSPTRVHRAPFMLT